MVTPKGAQVGQLAIYVGFQATVFMAANMFGAKLLGGSRHGAPERKRKTH